MCHSRLNNLTGTTGAPGQEMPPGPARLGKLAGRVYRLRPKNGKEMVKKWSSFRLRLAC